MIQEEKQPTVSIYLCIGNCLSYSAFNICTWIKCLCMYRNVTVQMLLAQAQSIKIIL